MLPDVGKASLPVIGYTYGGLGWVLSQTYRVPFVGGTGAGDAFDAGYIMGLLRGEGPESCLRWGSALGASCVRAIGATESVFTRGEAEAFMRENELEIKAF